MRRTAPHPALARRVGGGIFRSTFARLLLLVAVLFLYMLYVLASIKPNKSSHHGMAPAHDATSLEEHMQQSGLAYAGSDEEDEAQRFFERRSEQRDDGIIEDNRVVVGDNNNKADRVVVESTGAPSNEERGEVSRDEQTKAAVPDITTNPEHSIPSQTTTVEPSSPSQSPVAAPRSVIFQKGGRNCEMRPEGTQDGDIKVQFLSPTNGGSTSNAANKVVLFQYVAPSTSFQSQLFQDVLMVNRKTDQESDELYVAREDDRVVVNSKSSTATTTTTTSSSLDMSVICDRSSTSGYHRQGEVNDHTLLWRLNEPGSTASTGIEVRLAEDGKQATIVFSQKAGQNVSFYGLASRGAGIRLPDRGVVQLKNLDVNHYTLHYQTNLYGSVPLVYAVDTHHPRKATVGLFWLSGAPLSVTTSFSPIDKSITFQSDGDVGSLLVLPGPTPADVLKQYYALTGRPMLPPLFSLGYHQCRWSYRDQGDVLAVNRGFNKHQIPYDAIWLDIDHTNDRRYFTWNGALFPDSLGMIRQLDEEGGRKLVTITDPHIKVDRNYHVYQQGHAKRYFVKKAGTSEEFHGHCWPGESVWIDFMNAEARSWYASLFLPSSYQGSNENVYSWIDMNEPSVFSGPEITLPMDETVHHGGYRHRQAHNLYGFYHSMATFHGHLLRSHGSLRPFLLTRSFFSGSQRYAAVWTGDNQAKWEHLRGSIPMLTMHSMSGIPFIGADVGGFFDDPEPELVVRWYQLGSLYPFFRGHSHEQTRRREPWLFDNLSNQLIAEAIRFRYQLLPYLYTTFFAARTYGTSIWSSRMFLYPYSDDAYDPDREETFNVGPSLFAAPALYPGQTEVTVTLPTNGGGNQLSFIDFWSGATHRAGSTVKVPVNLTMGFPSVVPLFIRAGDTIPLLASTAELTSTKKMGDVELLVTLNSRCTSQGFTYMDDGITTEFLKGDHGRQLVHVKALRESVQLEEQGIRVSRKAVNVSWSVGAGRGKGAASSKEFVFQRVSRMRLFLGSCALRWTTGTVEVQVLTMSHGSVTPTKVVVTGNVEDSIVSVMFDTALSFQHDWKVLFME